VVEEMAKVNPDLVVRDRQQKNLQPSLRCGKRDVAQRIPQRTPQSAEQEATIVQQQKDFQATAAHQQKQIEALTAGLQKVSDQLELSRPAPQTVGNNQ